MVSTLKLRNNKIEGECTIRNIEAVMLQELARQVTIGISVLLLGVPLLLMMWFPCLKRKLYYRECRLEEATHVWVINSDNHEEAVELQHGLLSVAIDRQLTTYHFTNRLLKYYQKPDGWFAALQYDAVPQLTEFLQTGVRGLNHFQAQSHFASYGESLMRFERKNWWQLVWHEVTRPMFLFVVFCVFQYAFTDYLEFGLCILAFTILATIFTVREKLAAQEEMESMLTKEREYPVLRRQKIFSLSSRMIVPGDVVFFRDGNVPFDGVLVEGAVLIDEASLTGQSFPVSKKEINLQEYAQTKTIPGESLLYEGTRIVQCRSSSNQENGNLGVAMLVTLTSSSSYKGQIMRTIKFPKNSFLEFEREALIFVGCVLATVVLIDLLMFWLLTNDPWKRKMLWRYLTLALATAVPPQLPTCMNVAAATSQRRLKKKSVLSNNLSKILENGRIDLICFDKTGTLTRKDLQFEGYVPYRGQPFDKEEMLGPANRGQFFEAQAKSTEIAMAARAFGCCHSLEFVQASNKVDGDPIEVELFKFGGYQLDSAYKHTSKCLGRVTRTETRRQPFDIVILRRFEFNSEDKRMSTICEDRTNPGKFYIFTKGAPEILAKLGKMPPSFDAVLSRYAQQGLRVLAITYRELQASQAQTIMRSEAQSNLIFVGFVAFENKLKLQSPDIVATLMKNQIRCVMLTGDNELTAKSIAKQLNFNPDEVRARCTPQQKAEYVTGYMKQGYKVMMAGDGVNDMLALKTAHVGFGVDGGWGMDFVGPLSGVLTVLEEGRASIVAGLAMLKIIATYGLLQFTAQTLASTMYSDLSNVHYIYLDVILNMLPIMLLPLSLPKPLTLERPYGKVLSLPTILSVLTPVVISLGMSIALAYRKEYALRNYHTIVLTDSQSPSLSNIAVSLLFVIAAGLTAGSLASMDWKFSWRRQNYFTLNYAIVGWGIIHLIPFVPSLQSLFAMSNQNMELVWYTILLTDFAVAATALFERLVMPRLTAVPTSHDPSGMH